VSQEDLETIFEELIPKGDLVDRFELILTS